MTEITAGTRIRYKGQVARPTAQQKESVDGVFVALDGIDSNERGLCLAIVPEESYPSEAGMLLILDGDLDGVEVLLAIADLDAVLEREDHHGFGYATRCYLGTIVQRELDAAVVEVANELRMTAEDLYEWADSKWGRWLIDAVYGRSEPATVETVGECLNRAVLEDLGIDVRIEEHPEKPQALNVEVSVADAGAIADALELLAGIDDGENTDWEDLERLARIVRAQIPSEVGS